MFEKNEFPTTMYMLFFRLDLWPKKVLLIQTFMGCLNQVDQGSNSGRALTGNIITN